MTSGRLATTITEYLIRSIILMRKDIASGSDASISILALFIIRMLRSTICKGYRSVSRRYSRALK